jgi:MFS family permease
MNSIRAFKKKIAWREATPSIFLVLNSFVWYIFTYSVFYSIVNELNFNETEKLTLFIIYYVGMGVSILIGSKLFPRSRNNALVLWLFMGTIATFLLTAVSNAGMLVNAVLALFLGASLGVGLPSCLSYFADSTTVENRGFVGGISWSIVGFVVLIFAFLLSTLGQWETIIALTVWRLLGGIVFLVIGKKNKKTIPQKSFSYLALIRKREILLYLFPWVMFSIINFAEVPLLEGVFGANFVFVEIVEYAIIGVVAVVGGTIADIAGRKRVVIAGFVMLGIEYAVLSVFSSSSAVLYLFLVLDGTTWGLLFSVFLTVIWGDLGENYGKEKYYTLGGLPFLLGGFLSILIRPYASGISTNVAFSFASFFLFLAVIPLMYAPETLPEKSMKDRELKSYLEKAQKIVQKEKENKPKKETDKSQEKTEPTQDEKQENNKDYDEARKLAEKYY